MRRDGRLEVGAVSSTDEAGEPTRRDSVEGRGGRVMEPLEGKMTEPLNSGDISTRLQRVAELSRAHPERVFTTLAHVIDLEWLREAYRLTRKDAAAGVDGQSAAAYGEKLEENLQSLLDRLHTGMYKAPPVRRVYIPKADGRTMRPLGVPTFEDKVLQRAVAMVLEAIYEQDFLACSYGFRPGRSAHQALQALWEGTMSMNVGWVLDVDIQKFFDELDHKQLKSFLDRRVKDGVIRRVVHKWLHAGVMEAGELHFPEAGTPQGGVISPLLANVYLHEVLDVWFQREIQPRLQGRSLLVRYADDSVMVFEREDDARRVLDVLPKRFGRFGLRRHPEKTRLVRFERPDDRLDRTGPPPARPETFDFLGFTHHWGRSRSGRWVVKRQTARSRLSRALKKVKAFCQMNRHLPVADQHARLSSMLRGHYGYYGITGNGASLGHFHHAVRGLWRKWLDRRSQRARMSWDRYYRLLVRYPLPPARVVHSVYRLSASP